MRTVKTLIFNKEKRKNKQHTLLYVLTRYYLFYILEISIVDITVDMDIDINVDINAKCAAIYTFILSVSFILTQKQCRQFFYIPHTCDCGTYLRITVQKNKMQYIFKVSRDILNVNTSCS